MTNFTPEADYAEGVAIQPDGRIVVAGVAFAESAREFALARYRANGTLDTTFDGDGMVTTDFAGAFPVAYDVAIQADGKIVAVGKAFVGTDRFALARYNANGTLDTTFDGDGMVTTDFTARGDVAFGVALQADGKIVVAGRARWRFALARYNTDGSLDASFSEDGKQVTGFGSVRETTSSAVDVVVQPDGKIVAAGARWSRRHDPGEIDPRTDAFALARYNVDGTRDSTFSGDGKLITNFPVTPVEGERSYDTAEAVVLQANGRIVAAGIANGDRVGLARYRSDGTLDSSFSRDGKVMTNFTHGPFEGASDVALQASGKIVVAGGATGASVSSPARFALARYRADGTLDPTLSGDGKVLTNVARGDDWADAVAIQGNGRIVAAGSTGGGGRFALAGYLGG